MNNDKDIKELYQAGATEKSPKSLDNLILAQAKASCETPYTLKPNRRRTWIYSLSTAAVIVFGVSVIFNSQIATDKALQPISFEESATALDQTTSRASEKVQQPSSEAISLKQQQTFQNEESSDINETLSASPEPPKLVGSIASTQVINNNEPNNDSNLANRDQTINANSPKTSYETINPVISVPVQPVLEKSSEQEIALDYAGVQADNSITDMQAEKVELERVVTSSQAPANLNSLQQKLIDEIDLLDFNTRNTDSYYEFHAQARALMKSIEIGDSNAAKKQINTLKNSFPEIDFNALEQLLLQL
jgi:hypothetical protein